MSNVSLTLRIILYVDPLKRVAKFIYLNMFNTRQFRRGAEAHGADCSLWYVDLQVFPSLAIPIKVILFKTYF